MTNRVSFIWRDCKKFTLCLLHVAQAPLTNPAAPHLREDWWTASDITAVLEMRRF
jgi:hypothetical protein